MVRPHDPKHTAMPPPLAPPYSADATGEKAGILAFHPVRNATGGIVDLLCTHLNAEAAAILKRKPMEVVQCSIMDIHPSDLEATLFRSYAKVVETGEPLKIETEYIHNGLPLTWCISATRELGELVVRISDITEQQRQAPLLQERDRLQAAGGFVRLVGHEVRNPLTNILLAVEELETDGGLSPAQLEYLEMVHRNAVRIEVLIRKLLHSSREMEMRMVNGPLHTALSMAVANVADRCELRGARCTLLVDADVEDVPMESAALALAFTNLLVNAVEATEPGKGELSIHAENAKGRVQVTVSDNGKGMSPEDVQRMFQPFFTGRKHGLGLGLTEARNIFNAHHVLLTVESEEGKGTSFKLLFPLSPSLVPTARPIGLSLLADARVQ